MALASLLDILKSMICRQRPTCALLNRTGAIVRKLRNPYQSLSTDIFYPQKVKSAKHTGIEKLFLRKFGNMLSGR